MKARGIYVYGVWTTYSDNTQDWRCIFNWSASAAEKIAKNVRTFAGVKRAVVKRVYIAPPKGGRK